MADKNISSLPEANGIQDDTLMVGEQQGVAVKLTGAQWKAYAQTAFEANYDTIVSDVMSRIPAFGLVTQNGSVLSIK